MCFSVCVFAFFTPFTRVRPLDEPDNQSRRTFHEVQALRPTNLIATTSIAYTVYAYEYDARWDVVFHNCGRDGRKKCDVASIRINRYDEVNIL